jgi:glycosyltransferase involved in cell wall biosynthesis
VSLATGGDEPRHVLHVVLKFSSGVGSAIGRFTQSLPEAEHHLLSFTAVDGEGDLADHALFASVHRMSGGHLARIRRVREVVRELRPDVVHAHSSHGGAYARLAVSRRSTPLVYTPHCYAFERRDIGAAVRAAFWLVEALLAANTTVFAACSERERRLSAWPTSRARAVLVPNVAPAAAPAAPSAGGPLVVGGGRLSPQKDPLFFLAAVRRLRAERPGLRAVWLGDGDPALHRALVEGGVEVSGWLPRGGTMALLGAADLYLHSARWEGFPVMVAEAGALGVPTLVRDLPCFTGLPAELMLDDHLAAAAALLDDPAAAKANVRGWDQVLSANTVAEQRRALLDAYSGVRARRPV